MKSLVNIVLMFVCIAAMTQVTVANDDISRYSFGVSANSVRAEAGSFLQQVQNSDGTILEYLSSNPDASATGVGIRVGYLLSENWTVELDLVPNASSSRTVDWGITQIDPPPPFPDPGAAGRQRMDFKHQMFAMSAVYAHPVSDRIELTGRVGASWLRTEAGVNPAASQTVLDPSNTESRVLPFVGVGARYNFEAGPEAYADFGVGTESLMTIGIGLAWRF